jgi:hypothetical protein
MAFKYMSGPLPQSRDSPETFGTAVRDPQMWDALQG